MGICACFGRIANIIAPFSTFIVRLIPWLPGVIFGLASVIVGLLVLLCPETMGRPLPLTIEEVAGWSITPEKKRSEEAEPERPAVV